MHILSARYVILYKLTTILYNTILSYLTEVLYLDAI